jgi:hypothetical protein
MVGVVVFAAHLKLAVLARQVFGRVATHQRIVGKDKLLDLLGHQGAKDFSSLHELRRIQRLLTKDQYGILGEQHVKFRAQGVVDRLGQVESRNLSAKVGIDLTQLK